MVGYTQPVFETSSHFISTYIWIPDAPFAPLSTLRPSLARRRCPRRYRMASTAASAAQQRASALNGRTTDIDPDRSLPVLDAFGLALDDAPGPARTYAIAEGLLSEVLATLAREAGVSIDATTETVRGLTSPGVTGSFTLAQALKAALEGTGLTARVTSPTTVVVELRIDSESVDVSAGLPRVASPRYPTSVTETPQTIEVIPRAVIEQQAVTTSATRSATSRGSRCRRAKAAARRTPPATCSTCVASTPEQHVRRRRARRRPDFARIFNIEQVEVFMGPTGTDVGRGTAAGYVNMLTKAPTLDRPRRRSHLRHRRPAASDRRLQSERCRSATGQLAEPFGRAPQRPLAGRRRARPRRGRRTNGMPWRRRSHSAWVRPRA